MARSPFQVARDWSQKRKYKAQILYLLQHPALPPRASVGVPLRNDPVMSVALSELAKEHPTLFCLVMQPGGKMLVVKTAGLSETASAELIKSLEGSGFLLGAKQIVALRNWERLPGTVATLEEEHDEREAKAAEERDQNGTESKIARLNRLYGV